MKARKLLFTRITTFFHIAILVFIIYSCGNKKKLDVDVVVESENQQELLVEDSSANKVNIEETLTIKKENKVLNKNKNKENTYSNKPIEEPTDDIVIPTDSRYIHNPEHRISDSLRFWSKGSLRYRYPLVSDPRLRDSLIWELWQIKIKMYDKRHIRVPYVHKGN